MPTPTARRVTLAISTLFLASILVPLGSADNVNNNVVADVNDTVDEGETTTIRYLIAGTGGDGQSGCNAADTSPATMTIHAPSPVVASVPSVVFTACNAAGAQFVNYSSPTAGDYLITVSIADSGPGRYSINANFTLHVLAVGPPPDTDLPTISATVSPDIDGWYNIASGAPTISFSCSDASSAIVSCGPDRTLGDGAGQMVTGWAEDAAGNRRESLPLGPFDVDLTPPSITVSPSPSGWYNGETGAPTASFECSDDLSGIAIDACPQPIDLGEGAGQIVEGSVSDIAGNSASVASAPFDIDLTDPSISASLAPDAAPSGWYNIATGAPTVSFECSDALSGIALDACPGPVLLEEGLDRSAEGTVHDVAGNDASASSVPVDIDLTAPTIAASLSPAPADSGWYNIATGAPTVSFACSDALSGIPVDACPASVLLEEGVDQSAEGSVEDAAGNGNRTSSEPVDIDLTAPVLSLPASFSVFATEVGGGPASFSVSATDNLDSSPEVTCSAASGDLFALGATVVECEAVDEAGNLAMGSFTVTVRYNAQGFLQPVKENKLNVVKAGSTVPLKFAIRTPGGGSIGDLAAVTSFTATAVVCVPMLSDPLPFTTTGGTSLRYDSSAGQFIQNWKTPTTKGCVRTTVTLADGSQLSALFQLK